MSWVGRAGSALSQRPLLNFLELLERKARWPPNRLAVLTYHRIDEPAADGRYPGLVSATPDEFASQMSTLALRYNVVSISDVLEAMAGSHQLPDRAVLLTFDDAVDDFKSNALPVLETHGLPGVVFVPTDFVGDVNAFFWWDAIHAALIGTERISADTPTGVLPLRTARERRAAYRQLRDHCQSLTTTDATHLAAELCRSLNVEPPAARVMDWDQLREVEQRGISCAPHTCSHAHLDHISAEQVRAEIEGSLDALRQQLQNVPPVFAYPAGRLTETVQLVVREAGIELAFTTDRGANDVLHQNPLAFRRVNVSRTSGFEVARAQMIPACQTDRATTSITQSRRSPGSLRQGDSIGHISVVVSRFPKFTETFVVNEVLALRDLGVDVDIHPLLPIEPEPHQPAARALVRDAHFGAPWGAASLRSFFSRAIRQPLILARITGLAVSRTWRRPDVLIKDLVLLPRICAIADDLDRRGVQHVHAHFATRAGFAVFCLGRLTGIPYSIVAHGSDVHRHQLMLAEKMAEAAFVATVSDYNRQVMRASCDEATGDRIEVVRIGIDLSPSTLREQEHGPENGRDRAQPPLLLCVGTLHEVKGQQFLVRAMAELRNRGRTLRLQLIGDGEDRAELEHLVAELELQPCVEFVGALAHDDVLRRYAEAAIVISPSVASTDGRKEGIPTVLIEAMARGTNVIASDLAGISELVEHEVTGLLTPQRDAHSIADAVDRILEDPVSARQLADAAQSRVYREYDIRRTAARMYELMDRSRMQA